MCIEPQKGRHRTGPHWINAHSKSKVCVCVGVFSFNIRCLELSAGERFGIAGDTQLRCVKVLVRTESSKAVRRGCQGLVGPSITAFCMKAGSQVTVKYSSALRLND
jgi:hypothetical protein